MKRYGNLYESIYDINNIKLAHKNARKDKTHYDEVKMVDADEDNYCDNIHHMLKNKTFVNGEYDVFEKKDKGKLRVIYKLPYYPDRIIHHAIMQILEPIWKKSLIDDTFQSIKGRGIHKAKERVQKAVNSRDSQYCLKLDVQKFYPSIGNDVLKQVVRKKIKCKGTLWLLDVIIESIEGLPIGNYISQYLGNLTLSSIDHLVKEKYKIKYYYRYCDDIVVMYSDKDYLHFVLSEIGKELGKLGLNVKKDYQVFPIGSRGLDFVGFVFGCRSTRVRKSIKTNMFTSNKVGLSSYYGWIKAIGATGLWYDVVSRSSLTNNEKCILYKYTSRRKK